SRFLPPRRSRAIGSRKVGAPTFTQQWKRSYPTHSRLIFRIQIGVRLLNLNLILDPLTIRELSKKFSNNKLYDNCSDLSRESSFLRGTCDSAASSLSAAFVATPAKPDGWISWAIDPTGTGMVGAQALTAVKHSDERHRFNSPNLLLGLEKLALQVLEIIHHIPLPNVSELGLALEGWGATEEVVIIRGHWRLATAVRVVFH
ncbi:hypothetical protein U1Q18_014073, partial [Sarracenia purpurea var. burkii]